MRIAVAQMGGQGNLSDPRLGICLGVEFGPALVEACYTHGITPHQRGR
jgi:hypothetical protein